MTQIQPLYDKKFDCSMCKRNFTSKKVRSRFVKVTNYDSDFCPTYTSEESNPMFYYVKVCPHCGFSFTEEFSPLFAQGTKEIILEKVSKQWVPRDFGGTRDIQMAIQSYKLASFCGTLKREKHISIAGLYMRLAWLYRSLQNEEQETRFMILALNEYMESFTNGDYQGTQVTDIRMLYIIGELSRRTGNVEQAVKYFSKVIEQQKYAIETKTVEMAKERWYEIREMNKELEETIN